SSSLSFPLCTSGSPPAAPAVLETSQTHTGNNSNNFLTRGRDGVRYKAKLIGVDPLPDPQGEKMLLDSMMKLKGFEVSARKRGQHKMRIWLKISSSGLKILDERTGVSQTFHLCYIKRKDINIWTDIDI
uniref:PID domain-containing protein n=1 Tax=Xiphophorus couchianus TaxID=32473 RepID=A0A3B5LB53_9TELE